MLVCGLFLLTPLAYLEWGGVPDFGKSVNAVCGNPAGVCK